MNVYQRIAQSLKFGFFAALLAIVGFGVTNAHAVETVSITFKCDNTKAYFFGTGPLNIIVLDGDKYIQIDPGLFAAGNGKIIRVGNKKDHIEIRKYISVASHQRNAAAQVLNCK